MNSDPASGKEIILAIEAAVRGGSIALIDRDREIGSWHGTEAVSRAEDLLWNIAELLARTEVDKRRLARIAVSNGPGSYTGIRIGIATALGLAKALNIDCVGVPLLEAIAKRYRGQSDCIVAVPIGRNELCWQAIGQAADSTETPVTGSPEDLVRFSIELADTDILLQHDAYEALADTEQFHGLGSRAYDCGRDLASAIGFTSREIVSDINPNYVRNARFSSNPF